MSPCATQIHSQTQAKAHNVRSQTKSNCLNKHQLNRHNFKSEGLDESTTEMKIKSESEYLEGNDSNISVISVSLFIPF